MARLLYGGIAELFISRLSLYCINFGIYAACANDKYLFLIAYLQ